MKCTEWPGTDLKDSLVKRTLSRVTTYPLGPNFVVKRTLSRVTTYPEGPNFVSFTLRTSVFEIQACRKSEMHRMSLNVWKVPCVHQVLATERFRSTNQKCTRYGTFYHFPLDHHIKRPNKEQKFDSQMFHIYFYNSSQNYTWIWGNESDA